MVKFHAKPCSESPLKRKSTGMLSSHKWCVAIYTSLTDSKWEVSIDNLCIRGYFIIISLNYLAKVITEGVCYKVNLGIYKDKKLAHEK